MHFFSRPQLSCVVFLAERQVNGQSHPLIPEQLYVCMSQSEPFYSMSSSSFQFAKPCGCISLFFPGDESAECARHVREGGTVKEHKM